ncbi:MAG: 6,7-dimethyl-8-ribityllumazine synthase [Deltaproteobacteria bacterium]|nr:6,7-dimethyl-8-ribityllumazine synthase [Deltaproteobacteria bacterium]
MVQTFEGSHAATGLRLGIIVSSFNAFITQGLLEGALDAIGEAGGQKDQVIVIHVPGAFEIPLAAQTLAANGDVDAIICLGCLIRGETLHFELISAAVTEGMTGAMLESNIPMTLGVITAENVAQAKERSGKNEINRGREAAKTAIQMANLMKSMIER